MLPCLLTHARLVLRLQVLTIAADVGADASGGAATTATPARTASGAAIPVTEVSGASVGGGGGGGGGGTGAGAVAIGAAATAATASKQPAPSASRAVQHLVSRYATSVLGLQLLVYEALSYQCMLP